MSQMTSVFDITGSHISQLNDTDLRTLVARLCEAELYRAGLPVSAVTAGGDQNAADGGIDVRVDLPPATPINGFVPRPATGFQVKVSDMPRGAILEEMRPHDIVRPAIEELVSVSGAYIIISANGSTADSALRQRRKAMRDAVSSLPNAANLAIDFYDRERLAIWVRQHPSLVVWVREQIGQPISGWRPYANWASPNEGIEAEYLLDGKTRFHDWRSLQDGPLTIVEGIQRIRAVLAQPRGTVRLVGLSGTGKTRLVQALFDPRVGGDALERTLAIYTDLDAQPEPSPRDLMRRLVQNRQRAIVVIDNCLPDTHRALTAICAESASNVSLITVEFDVGEDEPEGTEVFRLEPASDDVIEHLLERRVPHVSQADRRRIAVFSGGNARMALALAQTVGRGDSIARLTDNELFKRLFHQRNALDDSLMRAAEACSLVYSFDGETIEGETAELPLLADLASMTVDQLYRYIALLQSRDLMQKRGQWRAVLPLALANRLARQGLDRIPPTRIKSIFLERAEARLLQSFTHRLGYLHDSEPARKIVQSWLAPGGLLSNIEQFSPLGIAMFRNVTPVDPAAALAAIERATFGPDGDSFFGVDNGRDGTWITLLQSIAYDAELFPRGVALLARFAMAENQDHNNSLARNAFKQLFFIHLSGTHASIEQRLQAIESLINGKDAAGQTLGLEALDALLEAWHFTGHSPDFGARPRDYGWWPASKADVVTWYSTAIGYVQDLALSGGPLAASARTLLAKSFRGLWNKAGVPERLEVMARALAEQGFWLDGWVAVKATIRYDGKQMPTVLSGRLLTLEQQLRPNGLLQTAGAYLLSEMHEVLDVVDGEAPNEADNALSAHQRAEEITATLGHATAGDRDVLDALLPDLLGHEVKSYGFAFGKGLAAGASDLVTLWQQLIGAFAARPERDRNPNVLRGYLRSATARDPATTDRLLDDAVSNPVLGPWFPALQTAVEIGESGAARLETALQLPLARPWVYEYLAYGRVTDSIPPAELRRIVLSIASLPEGFEIAGEVLAARLFAAQRDGELIDDEFVQCGKELLALWSVTTKNRRLDYHLAEIVKACFAESEAIPPFALVCRRLADALNGYCIYISDYPELLTQLFRTHPIVALDEVFGGPANNNRLLTIWRSHLVRENPLDAVQTETLIAWAQADPSARFPILASVITPFTDADDGTDPTWTPAALELLRFASDRVAVLAKLILRFVPNSWSGSLADILVRRRVLLRPFLTDADTTVADWARQRNDELEQMILRERMSEQGTNEGFE